MLLIFVSEKKKSSGVNDCVCFTQSCDVITCRTRGQM